MAKKRKIDINAFPEKVLVIPEVSLTRKELKQMYERMVMNVNGYLDDDGVELSTSEMLEFVSEAKFASIVERSIMLERKYFDTTDLLLAICGYDLEDDHLPNVINEMIQATAKYKELTKVAEAVEHEREIRRIIEKAEKLGLKVTP